MADTSFGPDIGDSFYADDADTSTSDSPDLDLSFGDDRDCVHSPDSDLSFGNDRDDRDRVHSPDSDLSADDRIQPSTPPSVGIVGARVHPEDLQGS